jgi:hypothetical protein
MKNFNKLHINSEKIIKNEELHTLRGGNISESCDYVCYVYIAGTVTVGVACGTGVLSVQDQCNNIYSSVGGQCSCIM